MENNHLWIENMQDVEKLIQDGYVVKVAGARGFEGWWAIKSVPYKNNPSYRVKDCVIDELKRNGYKIEETMYSYKIIKA